MSWGAAPGDPTRHQHLQAFWTVDLAEGEILHVTPSFSELAGRSLEEAYGEVGAWAEFVHSSDREAFRANVERIDGGVDHTYRIVTSAGEIRWVRERAFPALDREGRRTWAVGIVEPLEPSPSRTAATGPSEASSAVGNLAGGVGHHLNNLLTVILGHLQILKADLPVGSPSLHDVERIDRAAREVGRLTGMLMAIGERQILDPGPTDLGKLLGDAVNAARERAGPGIRISLEVPKTPLPPVQVDPVRIRLAVDEIIANALEAMPRGGECTVTLAKVELGGDETSPSGSLPPGTYAAIRVSDSGPGISPELRERIFEPFYSGKGKEASDGLGLAVAAGTVRQSGGFIDLESERGRGSTFSLYLPIDFPPTSDREPFPSPEEPPGR